MVNFKISRSIKAGKIYFIARSRVGTIRRDTLKQIEGAIEEYNKRIEDGEIKVKGSEEELSESPGESGEPEGEAQEEVKIEDKVEEKKNPADPDKKSSGKRFRTSPQKFSGYRSR